MSCGTETLVPVLGRRGETNDMQKSPKSRQSIEKIKGVEWGLEKTESRQALRWPGETGKKGKMKKGCQGYATQGGTLQGSRGMSWR